MAVGENSESKVFEDYRKVWACWEKSNGWCTAWSEMKDRPDAER